MTYLTQGKRETPVEAACRCGTACARRQTASALRSTTSALLVSERASERFQTPLPVKVHPVYVWRILQGGALGDAHGVEALRSDFEAAQAELMAAEGDVPSAARLYVEGQVELLIPYELLQYYLFCIEYSCGVSVHSLSLGCIHLMQYGIGSCITLVSLTVLF
jgi:hypothetical protein